MLGSELWSGLTNNASALEYVVAFSGTLGRSIATGTLHAGTHSATQWAPATCTQCRERCGRWPAAEWAHHFWDSVPEALHARPCISPWAAASISLVQCTESTRTEGRRPCHMADAANKLQLLHVCITFFHWPATPLLHNGCNPTVRQNSESWAILSLAISGYLSSWAC